MGPETDIVAPVLSGRLAGWLGFWDVCPGNSQTLIFRWAANRLINKHLTETDNCRLISLFIMSLQAESKVTNTVIQHSHKFKWAINIVEHLTNHLVS